MEIPIETEYNTLRNEILSEMEMQTNLRIAMCTLTIAIFSFAVEQKSEILCLVAFIVLIPFRLLIHSKQFGILRISAYIIVQFESKYSNLKWESIVSKMPTNFYDKKSIKDYITRGFGYCTASLFGILIAVFYCIFLEKITFFYLGIIFICLLIIFFLDFGFSNEKIRNRYIEEFKKLNM